MALLDFLKKRATGVQSGIGAWQRYGQATGQQGSILGMIGRVARGETAPPIPAATPGAPPTSPAGVARATQRRKAGISQTKVTGPKGLQPAPGVSIGKTLLGS